MVVNKHQLESRIKNEILNILEIPGKDLKKVRAYIDKEEENFVIKLKVDLHNLEVDVHNLVHNIHLRSDRVDDRTNTRELSYKVPDQFKDEVKELHALTKDGNLKENEDKINKVLDKVDDKKQSSSTQKVDSDKPVTPPPAATADKQAKGSPQVVQPGPDMRQPAKVESKAPQGTSGGK
jgi:hypothetical protein